MSRAADTAPGGTVQLSWRVADEDGALQLRPGERIITAGPAGWTGQLAAVVARDWSPQELMRRRAAFLEELQGWAEAFHDYCEELERKGVCVLPENARNRAVGESRDAWSATLMQCPDGVHTAIDRGWHGGQLDERTRTWRQQHAHALGLALRERALAEGWARSKPLEPEQS